ncbi:permease [Lentibacillus sediminis]|uniref:permease n=1 Tax=Lentibacillus sediminis TaxID=1940529 RepID=UPI001EFE79EC|nr:permease [Lentibacillus sediminis]
MYNRLAFIVMGVLFLLMGILYAVVAIMANSAPVPQIYIIFAMAVMSFCLSYLFPQSNQKDERMKFIRQKGMFISFFAFLIYSQVFTGLIQFDVVHLSAMAAINMLTALMISTVFISWVVLARIY